MRGDGKRKKAWFRRGHVHDPLPPVHDEVDTTPDHVIPFQRLTSSQVETVLNRPFQETTSLDEHLNEASPVGLRLLRPKLDPELEVEKNAVKDRKSRGEADTYRIVHVHRNAVMWNETFREHRMLFPKCNGFLHWDLTTEGKWGLCNSQKMVCTKCNYSSDRYQLYEEVASPSPKRGRRAGKINRTVQIGLSQTPIGPTSLRKVLMSSHIPPPSASGLQKTSASVCGNIKSANVSDMAARRENLKKINKVRGDPENVISAESDGAYNNKLYSGVGKTPFQPATQCNYLVVENVTRKKQVIAMENVNKLCSKHGMHTGTDTACDIKSGPCTATELMEQTIGDEGEWARRCLMDLKNSDLEVKYLTTDPDTKAFQAAELLFACGETDTQPEHFLDTRHVTDNHRKFLKGNTELLNIMPRARKSEKEELLGRFALDLSKRCQGESESLRTLYGGRTGLIEKDLPLVIDCVIRCYCGDHSRCKLYSWLCEGTDNDNWVKKSVFLPNDFQLEKSDTSDQVLKEAIMYRLNEMRVEQTKFGCNSQKVEATNRVLRRSVPTNVTYTRNFDSRSHSAVHSVNFGPGESLIRLMKQEGCAVPAGSRVATALLREQQLCDIKKKTASAPRQIRKRLMRKCKLYQLHQKHREEIKYKKKQALVADNTRRQTQARIKRNIKMEHSYPAKNQGK